MMALPLACSAPRNVDATLTPHSATRRRQTHALLADDCLSLLENLRVPWRAAAIQTQADSPIPVAESLRQPLERPQDRLDFGVAIICALPIEATAISALFDQSWDAAAFGKAPGSQAAGRKWR